VKVTDGGDAARKLARRDLLATLIIAAVVVPFIGYSARESMPFVHDPRGMAAVGVAGGLLAFAMLGYAPFGTGSLEQAMGHLAVLTLGCGIAALLGETSWAHLS